MNKIIGLSAAFLLLFTPVSEATKGSVLKNAGVFGIVRTISNSGANAQPMDCKNSDGNQGYRSQKTFFVDPRNPNHLGVGIEFKGFYTSSDAGKTWKMSSTGLIGYPLASNPKRPCHTEFSVLAMDPQNSKRLVLARAGEPGTIKDYFSENAGLYESTNGGESWRQILTQNGIGVYVHDGLAISHQNSQVIYAGTTTNARTLNGDNKIYVSKGIIYKTINGGITWTELSTGAPKNIGTEYIVIDPLNDKIVTVATFGRIKNSSGNVFGAGLGIIKTTDGGKTWKRIDSLTSGFSAIEFSENNPLNAIGITYESRVLATSDGGATWNPVNGISTLRSVGYDPQDQSGSSGLVADEVGKISKFNDNGASVISAGSIPTLANHATRVTRLVVATDGSWYAAGHYTNNKSHQVGFIFKTTDFGNTWVKILDTDKL